MEIDGAVAIVTGSATGIGAATARLLASKGCNLVVNYRRSEREAEETVAACEAAGAEALTCRADVADDGDCRRLAAAAVERWGRVDALVNNAGVTKYVAFEDLEGLSAEDFQRLYAVNVIGAYQMTRAVAPHMTAAGQGAIVNVSSITGVMGVGSSIAYAASKGALNTMTLALARALAPEIRVNAVCPGFVQTRWTIEGAGLEAYEKQKAHHESHTPLKLAGTPEEIAKAVVFFVEGADHVTGEILIVDAGWHLGGAGLVAR